MDDQAIANAIKGHLKEVYPGIKVEVRPWDNDPTRRAVYFTEEKFSLLYPKQRYHYLIHNIPEEFYKQYLSEAYWFELAPNENPDDLIHPDDDLINEITHDVLNVVERSGFFDALDDVMAPEDNIKEPAECYGDFRLSKQLLQERGFGIREGVDEIYDICHVFMAEGGFCDCEILLNTRETSRLKERYWRDRAKDS